MHLVADLASGVAGVTAPADGRHRAAFAASAFRAGTFAAAAERATRLLLLSATGAIEDDPDATAEVERAEATVLFELALLPAASDREYDVKRSTFAGFASRRDDNLHALLDAALDADAARLREGVRSRRLRGRSAGGLVR